jgi:hypothetical protein
MQRQSTAALCLLLAVMLLACSRNGPPSSLFESSGYHVRDGKVYYLDAFPGTAVAIDDADPDTFEALDSTYGVDRSRVYLNGVVLPDADAASFELLDRPGWAKDSEHVFQREHAISDDTAHFELLDGELAKDSRVVYWSDGSVLSDDPAHFTIICNVDHYLYTKDSSIAHVNGNPISGADPATLQVLQGAYSRDDGHAFYFDQPIADADLSSFRPLEGPYATDSARAYWMGKTIDGANAGAFRVLNANFECSADDQRAYYRQAVIAAPTHGRFRRAEQSQTAPIRQSRSRTDP